MCKVHWLESERGVIPRPAYIHFTEVRFAIFLSGGSITAIVVKSPERKLAKRTSVHLIVKCITTALLIYAAEIQGPEA